MSYRTILVLTDTSTASDDRIACACRLARQAGLASFAHRIVDDEPG